MPSRHSREADNYLIIRDLALEGSVWAAPHSGRYTPPEKTVLTTQQAGRASGPVWMGPKSLTTSGVRSPDRLVRSDSLHRLRYSGLTNFRNAATIGKQFQHLNALHFNPMEIEIGSTWLSCSSGFERPFVLLVTATFKWVNVYEALVKLCPCQCLSLPQISHALAEINPRPPQ
jgi:hypothetical protein